MPATEICTFCNYYTRILALTWNAFFFNPRKFHSGAMEFPKNKDFLSTMWPLAFGMMSNAGLIRRTFAKISTEMLFFWEILTVLAESLAFLNSSLILLILFATHFNKKQFFIFFIFYFIHYKNV